jgi:hypothetical protein
MVFVRPAIALVSWLILPACDTGSPGDDALLDTGADAGTTEDPGSEGDPSGPGPTTGDPSATTTNEPTTGEPTTSEPTTRGEDTTADPTADPTAETGTTGGGAELPPTNGAELQTWLETGEYLEWAAESGVHASDGPHFGGVRTFVNDALFGSLEARAAAHPEGAAAVKELYGGGGTVLGWSVMVKVQADAGGDGWYWNETYEGNVYGDGIGDGSCTGCHGGGDDYVLTPFPLQ